MDTLFIETHRAAGWHIPELAPIESRPTELGAFTPAEPLCFTLHMLLDNAPNVNSVQSILRQHFAECSDCNPYLTQGKEAA